MAVKLSASVIVRDELGRYLEPCIAHLLEFCNEVRILDDGSTDGWAENLRGAWGKDGRRVISTYTTTGRNGQPAFYQHATARNQLLQFTLQGWPTHILAIDADEMIADGAMLRKACEQAGDVWSLTVQEIWQANGTHLFTREDGGWRSHEIGILWRT